MKKILLVTLVMIVGCSDNNKKNNLKINNINKQLNVKSSNVTVLVEVSFKDEIDVIKKFITDEQSPLFYELNDDGIIRFEWFLNEENKTGILIEEFKNSNVWEELGNKVLGSPINLRFRELFKLASLIKYSLEFLTFGGMHINPIIFKDCFMQKE